MDNSLILFGFNVAAVISALVLIYFLLTHIQVLKKTATSILDIIKRMIIVSQKQKQVEEENEKRFLEIEEKTQATIKEIDERFEKRTEDLNKQIQEALQNKK